LKPILVNCSIYSGFTAGGELENALGGSGGGVVVLLGIVWGIGLDELAFIMWAFGGSGPYC
jgi:hypothetical protein